jgi:hypothetical protein
MHRGAYHARYVHQFNIMFRYSIEFRRGGQTPREGRTEAWYREFKSKSMYYSCVCVVCLTILSSYAAAKQSMVGRAPPDATLLVRWKPSFIPSFLCVHARPCNQCVSRVGCYVHMVAVSVSVVPVIICMCVQSVCPLCFEFVCIYGTHAPVS